MPWLVKMRSHLMPYPALKHLPMFLSAIFFIIQFVHCIPTDPSNSVSGSRKKVSRSLGAPVSNCATFPHNEDWFQPSRKFDVGDCPKAINIFYHDYVKDHNNIKYEFLPSEIHPIHGIPTQRVPLKVGFGEWYSFNACIMARGHGLCITGTCTVVIAMRNMFKLGELPGEKPFRSAGSDISSFTQLFKAIEDVNYKCNEPYREPGWYPAGECSGRIAQLYEVDPSSS